MKIYEIIAEQEQVNEGLGSAIGKGLAWLGNKAAASNITKSAITTAAEKWAELLIKRSRSGKSALTLTPDAMRKLAPAEARRYLSDPKYLKQVEKEANKIVRNKHMGNIKSKFGGASGSIGSAWDLTKAVGSAGIKLFNTWQIAGFFMDYNSNVDAWDAELKKQVAAKQITPEQYQEQIAHIRKTEMGLLITKVGAGLLGSAIVRGTVAPVANGLKLFKATAPLGSMVAGLGAVGGAYVYNKLNSKEGSEMLAKVMVGNTLGDIATGALGNAGTTALDWLTGTVQKGQQLDQQPQTGTPTPNAQQGASTTPVAQPAAAPAATAAVASAAPVMPGENKTAIADVDTPAGYTRDANGNLILK